MDEGRDTEARGGGSFLAKIRGGGDAREGGPGGEARGALHEELRRDLEDLLSTRRHLGGAIRGALPHVSRSVLFYGLPDLGPLSASVEDASEGLREEIAEVVSAFEPRLVRPRILTLDLRPGWQVARFRLEAGVASAPALERVVFDTEVNERGARCAVEEIP